MTVCVSLQRDPRGHVSTVRQRAVAQCQLVKEGRVDREGRRACQPLHPRLPWMFSAKTTSGKRTLRHLGACRTQTEDGPCPVCPLYDLGLYCVRKTKRSHLSGSHGPWQWLLAAGSTSGASTLFFIRCLIETSPRGCWDRGRSHLRATLPLLDLPPWRQAYFFPLPADKHS